MKKESSNNIKIFVKVMIFIRPPIPGKSISVIEASLVSPTCTSFKRVGGMILQGNSYVLGEESVTVPVCSQKMSHILPRV